METESNNSIEVEGIVIKQLGNGIFKVETKNGYVVLGHLSGKIRKNRVRIALGDRVLMKVSPYGVNKDNQTYGRIVRRLRIDD